MKEQSYCFESLLRIFVIFRAEVTSSTHNESVINICTFDFWEIVLNFMKRLGWFQKTLSCVRCGDVAVIMVKKMYAH